MAGCITQTRPEMIDLKTPRGLSVAVPETSAEDPSERFAPDELEAIRIYYLENGYVVVKGVIPIETCQIMRAMWDDQVKPCDNFIYRQTTAKAEKHRLNENGWVMNPILNLQSLDPQRLGEVRQFACESVLTAPLLVEVFTALLGDLPKIVQSMYFEGNSATWEHQDTYYLDSETSGRMAGAWIALEPIAAEAGRFFVCPHSHQLELDRHSVENNMADNHEVYISSVVEKIRHRGLAIRAPRLEMGDVLFWNSKTIHGSLDSQHASSARSSVTCHAIPARDRFKQMQARVIDVPTDRVNGVEIFRPKDLMRWRNRLILFVESRFPGPFYRLKQYAIRSLVAHSD